MDSKEQLDRLIEIYGLDAQQVVVIAIERRNDVERCERKAPARLRLDAGTLSVAGELSDRGNAAFAKFVRQSERARIVARLKDAGFPQAAAEVETLP